MRGISHFLPFPVVSGLFTGNAADVAAEVVDANGCDAPNPVTGAKEDIPEGSPCTMLSFWEERNPANPTADKLFCAAYFPRKPITAGSAKVIK